jgi:hypothetical protein
MNEGGGNSMADDPALVILAHYGVKGMRWGVRNPIGAGGLITRKPKPKQSTDYKTTVPLRNRPPQSLTNMQLKKVNERMQLERKFSQMNPTRIDRGKDAVDTVLKNSIGTGLGIMAVVKIATDPKTREIVKKGAQTVSFLIKGGFDR